MTTMLEGASGVPRYTKIHVVSRYSCCSFVPLGLRLTTYIFNDAFIIQGFRKRTALVFVWDQVEVCLCHQNSQGRRPPFKVRTLGVVCAETFASFFSKVVESVHSALSSIRLLAWLFSESRVAIFVGGLCSGAKVLDDLSLESICQAGCG